MLFAQRRGDGRWVHILMFCGIPIEDVNEMATKPLPNPRMAYADFIKAVLERGTPTSLGDFQNEAGKGESKNLWVVNVAQHMQEAIQDDIVEIAVVRNAKDAKVHGYVCKPEAVSFWENGAEQGMTPEQILQGWKAMMSLGKETPDPDGSGA